MDDENYDELVCGSPLSNYYGSVGLFRRKSDGAYYLSLDDYSGGSEAIVTEEFATSFMRQFPSYVPAAPQQAA